MYESLNLPFPVSQAALLLGLALGLAFGVLAEITRFCLRRAVVGTGSDRRAAQGIWAIALAAALIGTQAAVAAGWIDFGDHRFLASPVPWLAAGLGGLLFGAGMVLTRGCISRLTVLTGSGNLRALTVLVVFAVVAHATLKGFLAPLRTAAGSVTAAIPSAFPLVVGGLIATAAIVLAFRSGARPLHLGLAALIGLLVPLGWVGTGFVLFDEFDPIAVESLSTTSPLTETLFWLIAGTSVTAGFGTGLVGGILAGALVSSLAGRRFVWASFESPRQTGRYLAGAVLMGFGGVLAGGCTLGAGLSGVATLSTAALIALVSIIAGGWATDRLLSRQPAGLSLVPAE